MKAIHILGIDVAKRKFDVNLRTITDKDPRQESSFANSPKGFKALSQWFRTHQVQQLHACLESTSRYGDALALFLHQQGHQVSLVNPLRTHHYASSRMVRTQNDTIDARLIADFCVSELDELAFWEPLSAAQRQLQELTRARDTLVNDKNRAANQLETASHPEVRHCFQRQIRHLERAIAGLALSIKTLVAKEPQLQGPVQLAESVPGVGLVTAATIVAELPSLKKMRQARSAIAFAGLDPINKTSGDTVATKPRISRLGSRRLRKALYMPALVALRYNPLVRALGERLKAKGKTGKCVVVAAMRKLLRLIFGVIKTGRPFDPNWKGNSKTGQAATV
jgi:transposase